MQSHPLDRLVLDTNVVVSAIISNSFADIISLTAIHQIEIYTCKKHLEEIRQTLQKPKVKKYLSASPKEFVEIFELTANLIEIEERFDRSPDPDDNYLFDLAYTAKAHYLVTNENALLGLKRVNKTNIVSMTDLRKMLLRQKK